MSDQKRISPLLDGFTLGAPISEHHGVVCCPAIKENTNKKYIVKKISIPASQVQFDALLLAGAYKDPGDAMEYFRENGENILKEAELLKKLSKIEGFLPYDGWQMEPITRRRLGYEIYLVGSYKRSLDKYIRKNAITHLEVVNLALDLCSALSVCRQSGYLYVDLKPSNIYVSEKKEYRIGDLGFLSLDSLRYASLSERYFSPYTPPELLDPMTPMNLTVDTYSVGMILYQLYNDGHLPFNGIAPTEPLPSPCHADYEMAEIIMKAIHPEPDQRWTDPKDLGKAIASYMQRNSVNDIPITTFVSPEVKPEDIVAVPAPKESDEDSAEQPEITEESEACPAEVSEIQDIVESDKIVVSPEEIESLKEAALQEESTDSAPESEITENVEYLEDLNGSVSEEVLETPGNLDESDNSPDEAVDAENSPSPTSETSETQEMDESDSLSEISEEVAKILSKANDIIAHEIPEDTAFPAEEVLPDPFAFATEDSEELDDNLPAESLMEEEPPASVPENKKKPKHFEDSSRKKKFKKFISGCFTGLLLCGVCVGGFWYYQNIFLQTIDSMAISGTQDQITVLVDTGVEESMLTVYCTDESGKRYSESVQGGKVTFSDLKPSTQYTIQVDMTGFHKLVGETTDVFTTGATTQIMSFEAIAGSEDGSVKLNFTVDGEDPDFWNIHYSAEGEEEKLETVTGHSATINGLTVGKVYTFTLSGDKNFDLGGETSIQYLASRLILAEDLTVTSSGGSDITVQWKVPGDVVVENWNVRCYDGYGFEEQTTVTDTSVQFTGIDPASHYTVEVTAAGMTQPSSIYISSDPIYLSNLQVDENSKTEMKLTWEYSGNDPEGGWLLTYTVDGSGMQVIPCEKAAAKISPLIPGANYEFVLQSADERTVINNTVQYQTREADKFTEHNFVPENVSFNLLKTPEDANWHYETISEDSFTNSFQVGESASMVLQSASAFYLPGNKTTLLFVFRDSYGNVLPELITEESVSWKSIWQRGDGKTGEINIPKIPTVPGEYGMDLYINGCSVAHFDMTITG